MYVNQETLLLTAVVMVLAVRLKVQEEVEQIYLMIPSTRNNTVYFLHSVIAKYTELLRVDRIIKYICSIEG
jgi:hypothetical protein